ncbi:spore germination protein [Cohnella sp. GCM10027633]|uniref:spore germination protein n=1 Tax=unclassified Cohnella TaxID=2636738 RepID=UPI00362F479C
MTLLTRSVLMLTQQAQTNVELIRDSLSHTEDLIVRSLALGDRDCRLLYLDSVADEERIRSQLAQPLAAGTNRFEQVVALAERTSVLSRIVEALLDGHYLILEERGDVAYLPSAAQTHERAIQEPKDEQTVIGPHEGFVERLNTNVNLMRNRLKSAKLKVNYFTVGTESRTKVAMLFMEGRAIPGVAEECARRIAALRTDHLGSITNLEEWIDEHPYSPFSLSLKTERPDRTASYLTEGKVVLMANGSTNALILPISFFSFYQSPDDYNSRWLAGTFYRLIRLASFMLAICLPAIYIAIVSFHSEVLPIGIFYSIKVSLTYVPFPPIMEAIVMQVILEVLKEAAIRLPSPIAQTIGIVGGLVIGTAVVEAQFVSNTMIVVIGLTAIASFVSPLNEFGTSLRILGFPIMVAAALFGFVGITLMLMMLVIHLCKLESFGVPYLSPFTHFRSRRLEDVGTRVPFWRKIRIPGHKGRLSGGKRWKTD